MRFRSTEESRRNNELTILSVIDTMAAMAVSIGIAIYTQSLLHIAIGACIAPLLLLRTDESVAMGKQLFEKYRPKPNEIDASDGFMMLEMIKLYITELIRFGYLVSLSLWVRIHSTAFCLIKKPFDSMMSVRKNWIQSVFCTDINHEPLELVPGSGKFLKVITEAFLEREGVPIFLLEPHRTLKKGFKVLYVLTTAMLLLSLVFNSLLLVPLGNTGTIYRLVVYCVAICGALSILFFIKMPLFIKMYFCMLIALSYRLSLKSTAILWLPLLLIPSENDSIGKHLKNERKSALSKLSRSYSSLVISLFIAKVFLLPQVIDWWNNLPTSKILNVWVMPEKLHPWHIAGAVGAGLNLVGYLFFYDQAPQKLQSGTWSETFVKNVAVSLKFVINSILIYTIPAAIYITWKAIDFVKLPKFHWNPFPWW